MPTRSPPSRSPLKALATALKEYDEEVDDDPSSPFAKKDRLPWGQVSAESSSSAPAPTGPAAPTAGGGASHDPVADAEALMIELERSLLQQHGVSAGEVGMHEISEIFLALTAVSAAEEHAAVHAPEDEAGAAASSLPWWCDVAGEGCLRPTESTSLGQYAPDHRCWSNGASYVCEVCLGTGQAEHKEELAELDTSQPAHAAKSKRAVEEEETQLIEALMDADRLHDAGYENAEQYTRVLEQVNVCKADVFVLLRTRLDAVQSRLAGG